MFVRLLISALLVASPALAKSVAYGDDLRVTTPVEGDAVTYGGDLEIDSDVSGNAVSFGGDLIVRGNVAGDVHAYGGNVVLAPGAKVGGRVTSVGGEVLRSKSAAVAGAVSALGGSTVELSDGGPGVVRDAPLESPRVSGNPIQEALLRFAVIFGLAWLARLIAPRRIFEMEQEIRRRPLRAAAAGLLVFLMLLPISALLGITGIGVPVAMALWFALFAAVALGAAAAIQALGRAIPLLRRRRSQALVLAAGAAVLALVGFLPWLDWVVYFAFAFAGLGAAVSTRFGSRTSGLPSPIFDR